MKCWECGKPTERLVPDPCSIEMGVANPELVPLCSEQCEDNWRLNV